MQKITLKDHLSLDELRELMSSTKSSDQFKRWQAIYIIMLKQFSAKDVSLMLNVSPHTIYQWIYYYNKDGMEGLVLKGKRRSRRINTEKL